MKFITSLLVVEDIGRSRLFYEKVLKQKVITDFGENVAFEGGFAIQQKALFATLIHNLPIGVKTHNFELYFEEDDLVRTAEALKENNVVFIHEIIEQPWKQRVMRFYDPDFSIVEIGERMEHVAYRLSCDKYEITEICRITYLPEETVKAAIESYSRMAADSRQG
jgi:catechol 2,3-dioxygenase-like lactoylglutathione lyase family enzyme